MTQRLLALGVMVVMLAGCQSAPSGMARDPAEAARTRTALAAQYIRQGDLDAAQRHLDQALQANPRSVEALTMMGVLLQTEGSVLNLQKADGFFRRAISLDPKSAQTHNNYGVYLVRVNRLAEAERAFELAGSTLGYEGRASALENLGRIQRQQGRHEAAEKSFRQALSVDGSLLVSRFEMADLMLSQGRLREAGRWYDDYLNQNGKQPQSARGLWLGMRIARLQQDQTRLQDYAEQLRQRHADSDEYRAYQAALQNPGQPWK